MAKRMILLLVACLSLTALPAASQDLRDLRGSLQELCGGFDGDVGIAVAAHGRTMALHGNRRYPVMSLVKVPVAVAALRAHERRGGLGLHEPCVTVGARWQHAGTYSPLRDHTGQRDTVMSLAAIIGYAVALSDNNMCDWLIAYAGGIDEVSRDWQRLLGQKRLGLRETEAAMNADIALSRNNWATPRSVVQMLRTVMEDDHCLTVEHRSFLRNMMEKSPTGAGKLKAGLPAHVPFAHKTGLSGRLPDGTLIASTDAGVMRLPDGTDCYLAVLVQDTKESNATIDKLMADIARCVFAFVSR